MKSEYLNKLRNKLIVSCQGYDPNTFHTSEDMLEMAIAADLGGCVGFRLNSPDHVALVRKRFPNKCIIGIWKQVTEGCDVYITPNVDAIFALKEAGADIIAVDGTLRKNASGDYGWETIAKAKALDSNLIIMADCSTFEEARLASLNGADIVSTTMSGYTEYTKQNNEHPDFKMLKQCKEELDTFVICEGKIWTQEDAVKCFECGADMIVVGTAITNPKLITKRFVDHLKEKEIWQ